MSVNLRQVTQSLRKKSTKAECKLWKMLRNKQFLGLKFIRQFPITFQIDGVPRFFVADFYCAHLRLIIELDGEIHSTQTEKDHYRDYIIATKGIEVIRLSNRNIEKDFPLTLQKLIHILTPLAHHTNTAPSLE